MHRATAPTSPWAHITLCASLLGCNPGPLPPEHPPLPTERAAVVPVEVHTSADATEGEPAEERAPTTGRVYASIGLSAPESVLFDAPRDVYWVSNLNGVPGARDNNGFISRLAPEGDEHTVSWIQGGERGVRLDAPQGLALSPDGGTLAVADIDHVRLFDPQTGEPRRNIPVRDATSLRDVVYADSDTLYLTDQAVPSSGPAAGETPGLLRLTERGLERLTPQELPDGLSLQHPSGLTWSQGRLFSVSSRANVLHALALDGTSQAAVALPSSGLDGIVALADDEFLISSREARTVFRGGFVDGFAPCLTGVESPADIGFDTKRQRILIPSPRLDVVYAQPLSSRVTALAAGK